MKEVALMNNLELGKSGMHVSEISLGCMRMDQLTTQEANRVIENALELGIDFFDHADIYGGGRSEEIFAEAIDMNPTIREKMVLQTKCGIRDGSFDFSKGFKFCRRKLEAPKHRLHRCAPAASSGCFSRTRRSSGSFF